LYFIRPQWNKARQEKLQKYSNTGKLNNSLLNNQWVIKEIKEEINNIKEKKKKKKEKKGAFLDIVNTI
jgi:vacuolar-type H+-ATPase subunit I/STV1